MLVGWKRAPAYVSGSCIYLLKVQFPLRKKNLQIEADPHVPSFEVFLLPLRCVIYISHF